MADVNKIVQNTVEVLDLANQKFETAVISSLGKSSERETL